MLQAALPLPPFLLPSQISPPSSSPCSFFLSLCRTTRKQAPVKNSDKQQRTNASNNNQTLPHLNIRRASVKASSDQLQFDDSPLLRRGRTTYSCEHFEVMRQIFNRSVQEFSVVRRRERRAREKQIVSMASPNGEYIHYAECGAEVDGITT
ncbi:uncharacterized protein LOC107005362 isoform X2 [Solanum pennellii]|uniref:Uncharacterized protein LOC107005362 isoform X2 n=1 Tax=Solanum pennellii TaxID=28526 RepID=A0ABM1V108_SOLPN|nr:uncharacterized protein LOC107005362 isoform X2 [Solanum pennellii]